VSVVDDNKDHEIKKIVKKKKLNKDSINNKNINKIKELSNNNNNNIKNDIIFEMYNNYLLTVDRLKFIMKYCTKYLNISSELIKKLIKNDKVIFLDIIFGNLKFYDNDFKLQLLFYYNYKKAISTSDLNQQISNKKFKISINSKSSYYNKKYLINECNKSYTNINIIIYKY